MRVEISLDGCDDSTYLEVDIDESQKVFIEKLSEMSKKNSTYGCMPTLSFKILTPKGVSQ